MTDFEESDVTDVDGFDAVKLESESLNDHKEAILKGLREIYAQNREILGLLKAVQLTPNTTQPELQDSMMCHEHGEPMSRGTSKTKFDKQGNPKTYWYHKVGTAMCFGDGVRS